jgi:hypothetical protein
MPEATNEPRLGFPGLVAGCGLVALSLILQFGHAFALWRARSESHDTTMSGGCYIGFGSIYRIGLTNNERRRGGLEMGRPLSFYADLGRHSLRTLALLSRQRHESPYRVA